MNKENFAKGINENKGTHIDVLLSCIRTSIWDLQDPLLQSFYNQMQPVPHSIEGLGPPCPLLGWLILGLWSSPPQLVCTPENYESEAKESPAGHFSSAVALVGGERKSLEKLSRNIGKWYRWSYLHNRKTEQRYGHKGSKGRGQVNWEIGHDIYTPLILCIKETANEYLLYGAGNSTHCSVVA